ncbi:hypothetical protein LBR03_00530 [Levilactobacillus brevis]|nr:hypothetical protein LBR03_00530 [Levilactobacillus brevis]
MAAPPPPVDKTKIPTKNPINTKPNHMSNRVVSLFVRTLLISLTTNGNIVNVCDQKLDLVV